MTASKKAVRTRRGVEPAGRPARREVERGRRARTNSSRTFAHPARAAAAPAPSCGRRASEAREEKARGGAAVKNTDPGSRHRFMRLRRGFEA